MKYKFPPEIAQFVMRDGRQINPNGDGLAQQCIDGLNMSLEFDPADEAELLAAGFTHSDK